MYATSGTGTCILLANMKKPYDVNHLLVRSEPPEAEFGGGPELSVPEVAFPTVVEVSDGLYKMGGAH